MENWQEDDGEIVLKNSELYNYLLNCNTEEFESYDRTSCNQKLSNVILRKTITKVPKEFLTNLNAILNSNILLDEDVTYLYGHTVDLINDLKTNKNQVVLFSSIIGFCSIIVALKYNSLIQLEYIFKSLLTVKSYYNQWHRTQLLFNLIDSVKKSNFFIKKTFQILHEESGYFKLQQLKSKTNGKTEEFDFLEKKKKAEIDTLSDVLCQCLIRMIQSTREATHCLINELPLIRLVDSKDQYLAFMTEEHLGLTAYTDKSLDTSISSNLEALKNIYLLMQSEFFRRLGLSFCPSLWCAEVPLNLLATYEVIEKYSKSCEELSSVIKYYYEKHILPDVVESRKPKDSTLVGGYSAIHKINTSLLHLSKDTRVLEEYIENIEALDKLNADLLCCKLAELRQNVDICADTIVRAEKYFSKLRRESKGVTEDEKTSLFDEKVDVNEKPVSNDHEVCKSTHNIDSKDRVYFAITEGNVLKEEPSERNSQEPIKFPNFLMTELKEALVDKKNEFQDRENKAVENCEEYKKFLDAPDIDPENSRKNTPQDLPVLSSSGIQMQKILASAIAQKSFNFIAHEEEQFGSSDESDCEA